MANFWDLSDGKDVTKTGSQFEAGGGTMQPIPDDTACVAIIEEAKVERDRNGLEYVSLRWSVLAPSEYKNRKVFQKIWCLDSDPRKQNAEAAKDKAKRMLFAVDKNAGGHIVATGRVPDDALLQKALVGKQMQIKVNVWEMEVIDDNGNKKSMNGNWIAAVSPKAGSAAKAKPVSEDVDDEIPF
jgi:hypothetical protein